MNSAGGRNIHQNRVFQSAYFVNLHSIWWTKKWFTVKARKSVANAIKNQWGALIGIGEKEKKKNRKNSKSISILTFIAFAKGYSDICYTREIHHHQSQYRRKNKKKKKNTEEKKKNYENIYLTGDLLPYRNSWRTTYGYQKVFHCRLPSAYYAIIYHLKWLMILFFVVVASPLCDKQ